MLRTNTVTGVDTLVIVPIREIQVAVMDSGSMITLELRRSSFMQCEVSLSVVTSPTQGHAVSYGSWRIEFAQTPKPPHSANATNND